MRLIYLLAADADASAAAEIEALLQQRGYVVRRAEEKLGFPPAQAEEITLAVWSRAVALSRRQTQFTNRAIDAWADGRLTFAQLDNSLLPRGLGDIEAIDLSVASGRVAAVWRIVEAAQEIDRLMAQHRHQTGRAPPESYDEDVANGFSEAQASAANVSVTHALIIGLVAAAAFMSTGYIAMPQASHVLIAGAASVWGVFVGAISGYFAARIEAASLGRLTARRAAEPNLPYGDPDDDLAISERALFVSFARRDGGVVYPMVGAVEDAGRPVWIDKDEFEEGGNRADVIVRAIRESGTFCLMCTAEAFQSDAVRRQVYIAHKYRRKFLPVRLDFSEVPEDFASFLKGRDWLDLTGVEPAELPLRLKAALVR